MEGALLLLRLCERRARNLDRPVKYFKQESLHLRMTPKVQGNSSDRNDFQPEFNCKQMFFSSLLTPPERGVDNRPQRTGNQQRYRLTATK